MSKDKCKYLDDEKIKKNLELFNSDREKFIKEANMLDFGKKSKEFEFRNDLIGKNTDNKEEIVKEDETKEMSIEEVRKKITKIDVTLIVLFMMFCFFCSILPETGNCSMGALSGPGCSSNGYLIVSFMSFIPFGLIIGSDLLKLSFIKFLASTILFISSLCVELANPGLMYTLDEMCLVLLILSVYFFIEEIFIKIIKNSNDN